MRTLMLICAGLAVIPGVAFAQLTPEQLAINESIKARSALEMEQMKDPEYRRALYSQWRESLAHDSAEYEKELGLSPTELGKFLDLLAEQKVSKAVATGDHYMLLIGSRGNSPEQVAYAARRKEQISEEQEISRRQDQEVAALLGADRHTRWKELESARLRVSLRRGSELLEADKRMGQIQRTLVQAGLSMSDAQRKSVTDSLRSGVERENRQAGLTDREVSMSHLTRALPPYTPIDARSDLKGIFDAVLPYLSASQLAVLRVEFDRLGSAPAQAGMQQ